eukprot:3270250-Amphidinium_carterae.1
MTPLNDVFKVIRCQAIIKALDQSYDCCSPEHLVFEGQEHEWKEELKNRRERDSLPSDVIAQRRDGIALALAVMQNALSNHSGHLTGTWLQKFAIPSGSSTQR